MHILLAEDDPRTAQSVMDGLALYDFSVTHAVNGVRALELLRSDTFDAAIVDRMMPELDGIGLIESLRRENNTLPVLMLSALGEVDDRVSGLRAGADDYLAKPFALDELVARLEVLVRRAVPATTQVACGDLLLDVRSRTAQRQGQKLDLLPREFNMLLYMAENKGRLVTRAMLLEKVFHIQFDPKTNVIDVHMSRLRAKLDKGFSQPLIRTVRGAGFILDDGTCV
jgi:two-component system OmpR family response regulator